MISIIIPAHNEERVIEATLRSILDCSFSGDLEVIVVCNGCSDGTADKVKSYIGVKLVETPTASKAQALNVGDKLATGFPRFYMDADIRVSANAFSRLTEQLESGQYLAGSPSVRMDFGGASAVVRGYYATWLSLPACRNGMVGAGIYALSKIGRERFAEFPNVIADDGYVRSLFSDDERICVEDAYAIVRSPTSVDSLIKIKTRSRLGGYELRSRYPHLATNVEGENKWTLLLRFCQISRWPQVFAYMFINLASRVRARRMMRQSAFDVWERDHTRR